MIQDSTEGGGSEEGKRVGMTRVGSDCFPFFIAIRRHSSTHPLAASSLVPQSSGEFMLGAEPLTPNRFPSSIEISSRNHNFAAPPAINFELLFSIQPQSEQPENVC
jgi:hypothetical protein